MPPLVGQFISTWDSTQPGALWDSGLSWDVNVPAPNGDPTQWTRLITSEHNLQPRFMATVTALVQAFADLNLVVGGMPSMFDLDNAAASQEDTLGLWVGVGRDVQVALVGVYFSLDDPSLGLDQGSMQGPSDPTTGLIILPDGAYRTLLRARIAANFWDGTVPGAYAAWNQLFAGTGFGILIQNAAKMHIIYALTGPVPDALTLALFQGGYLNLKPAAVMIDLYITPAVANTPYFGLDASTAAVAGLDVGQFGIETLGS
jgi:hypothetical protein